MDKDDDDDDEKSAAVSRYPVMPSLASLRLMRNRLHLAYLGKKLMKWTAISTGRELRKISAGMIEAYKTFSADMIEAFILLARCRYFFPNLNQRVLENCPQQANLTVTKSVKMGAGMKTTLLHVQDAGIDGYEHLGIDKGGQTIKITKEAWALIVKRIIMMLQYRTSFIQVELIHKNATKKVNVLQRVQIPRICMTVRYILTELDEQEREEMFRLKRFKEKKYKKAKELQAHVDKPVQVEETTTKIIDIIIPEEKIEEKVLELKVEPVEVIEPIKPIVKPVEVIEPIKPIVKPVEVIEPIKPIVKPVEVIEPIVPIKPIEQKQPIKKIIEAVKLKEPETTIEPEIAPIEPEIDKPLITEPKVCEKCIICQKIVAKKISNYKRELELLKKHLKDVIVLSREFLEKGFEKANVKQFISTCEEAQERIDQFVEDHGSPSQIDEELKHRLEHLKHHLREVIDVTRDFCDGTSTTTSSQHSKKPCAIALDEKQPCFLQQNVSETLGAGTRSLMEQLKKYIDEIMKLTEDYKREGLLSGSVEAFLESCDHVKSKINIYVKAIDEAGNQRLDLLCKRVTFVEELANLINQEDMEDFLGSCKNFKGKLNEYKSRGQKPPTEGSLAKLVSQIDKTKELSQEVIKEGYYDENIESFVQSCDDMKTHLQSKYKKEQPKCLKELRHNIDNVMKLVSKCRAEGLITESAEAFLKSCENAKAKIDVFGKHSQATENNKPLRIKSCTCSHPESAVGEIICDGCKGKIRKPPGNKNLYLSASDYGKDLFGDMQSEKVLHDTCLQDPFNEVDWLSYVSAKPSVENTCELCKKSKENNDKNLHNKSSGGYLQIVTKFKRVKNIDGSVREEKETIRIRNDRNYSKASIVDLSQGKHCASCSHKSLFDHDKKVNSCLIPNQNQRGFNHYIKRNTSEQMVGNASMAEPYSRQCISIDNLLSMFKNRLSPDSFSLKTSDSIIDYKESNSKNCKTMWNDKPSSSKKSD